MKRNGCNSGFTLIEVLIAMMIMAGAVAVCANAWTGNVARLEKSRINNTTTLLLQRKMAEIEILYRDKPLSEIKEEDGESFGDAFPQYRWTMESKEFEMPNISGALTAREGGADGNLLTLIRQMTEMIRKSVKEVKVTVVYKSRRSKKEIKNSVTAYFIDYTKDLNLMPGATGADGGDTSGTGTSGGTQ